MQISEYVWISPHIYAGQVKYYGHYDGLQVSLKMRRLFQTVVRTNYMGVPTISVQSCPINTWLLQDQSSTNSYSLTTNYTTSSCHRQYTGKFYSLVRPKDLATAPFE